MTSAETKNLSLTLKSFDCTPQTESPEPELISEVKKRVQTYNDNRDEIHAEREQKRQQHEHRLQENRQKGAEELTQHLKQLVPEKIKTYANYGKTEARIFEFTFGDELKYSNCYAKDLLSKGRVIADLQTWLDQEHSEIVDGERKRAFFIYFNMVGRRHQDRNANKYAVFVNWDPQSWSDIEERLTRSKTTNLKQYNGRNNLYKQRPNNTQNRRNNQRYIKLRTEEQNNQTDTNEYNSGHTRKFFKVKKHETDRYSPE